jgi:hypothetical protein
MMKAFFHGLAVLIAIVLVCGGAYSIARWGGVALAIGTMMLAGAAVGDIQDSITAAVERTNQANSRA